MDSHGPWVLSDEDIAAHLQRAVENDRPLSHLAERTIRQMVRRADGHPVAGPDLPATRALLELAYRRGIEQFDNSLGALMHGIAQRDVARDAAVIVTADHGEALFERAWGLHGDGLFEDELGVPLVARLPGVVAAGRIDCPVGLMDIVPTLCTYLGLDCAPATGGTSIIAAGSDPSRRSRYIVSEAVVGKPRHRAIRNQRYKLIWEPAGRPKTPDHTRAYALFDLRDDAREQTDLLDPAHLTDEAKRIFVTLRDALDAMDRATVVRPAGRVPLDAATQKRLESLGYLDR
jgi:arylsulfatase A-like enzyme